MSTTSARTVVRDALVTGFENLKKAAAGRVKDIAVSLRYLTEQETKQASTVCVVVTDEQRNAQTQRHDSYDMTAVVVLYAHDTKDPRAKLDLMIEDAIDTVLLAADGLRQGQTIWKCSLESITADEATTAAGPWAQAVLRWTVAHRRQAAA